MTTTGKDTELEGDIAWWGVAAAAIGLVVASTTFAGNFIGWGTAGPAFTISLLIGFGINLFVMFAYAELTTTFPKSGQVFEFTKQVFSDKTTKTALILATGIGTTYWLIFGLIFAPELTAGAHAIVDTVGVGSVTTWILLINLTAILVNMLGIRLTVIVETILVLTMVGIRVLMGVAAFTGLNQLGRGGDVSVLFDFAPGGIESIFAASILGVWAFIGLEFATPMVEEVKNPSKNIPKGMTVGAVLILAVAFIMGLGIITTYDPMTYPDAYAGNAPQIEIAGILFGVPGKIMAGLASFAATLGTVIVAYAGIPRIIHQMAREGLWPEQFAYVHPRFKSPWAAIGVTGVIMLVPTFFSQQVVTLINAGAAVWLLVYMWIFMLAIRLKREFPGVERPFSMPSWVYFAGMGLILVVLFQAYEGSYYLIGLALAVFVVGFTLSAGWLNHIDISRLDVSEAIEAGQADD